MYGGLYLDWDEVILKPVDKFRDYDITMVGNFVMTTTCIFIMYPPMIHALNGIISGHLIQKAVSN